MFVFEIEASDVYAVLGRVLDRTRVPGLRLAAVTAEEAEGGGYTISATVETSDRDMVDRLARQFAGIVGVVAVSVPRETVRRSSAFAGLNSPRTACPATHEEPARG